MTFADVGIPLSNKSFLRDSQGNIMGGGAMRQAMVALEGEVKTVTRCNFVRVLPGRMSLNLCWLLGSC